MDNIKALIFDLDGVIVNTEQNHFDAWKSIADSLRIPFSHQANEHLKGLSRVDSLNKILEIGNVNISKTQFDLLLQKKNNLYLESIRSLNKNNLLQGVGDLLERAKAKRIKLAVGSSSKNARLILSQLDIENQFDTIVDGNDVHFPKPHPEVFTKGAQALQVKPFNTVVFEDAISGIQAAQAGGFIDVGVGNHSLKGICTNFINDLSEFNLN